MTPINILLTGANGQLGLELTRLLEHKANVNLVATDVDDLDITSSEDVEKCFAENHFHWVVNCAAYTAVDDAEEHAQLCNSINCDGPMILAQAARRHECRMVHISTDYVFDGKSHVPYEENMPTNPCSVYGSTKLAGERAVLSTLPQQCVILRTSWLYSPHGKNFVKTMLHLGRTKPSLKVVFDQVGSPTYAGDLAQAVTSVIFANEFVPGIFHFSDEGVISWYDFTKAIFRLAGISGCEVAPCRSCEFPTRASRPSYSVLDKAKFKRVYNMKVPYWEESLKQCLERISSINNSN